MVMLFRRARAAPLTSAALRLHLSKAEGRTLVRILKRRGGGPAPVALDLHGAIAYRSAISFGPALRQHRAAQAGR